MLPLPLYISIPRHITSIHKLERERYKETNNTIQREKAKENKMVLLDHVWDDVIAGPQPERGLGNLRRDFSAKPLNIKGLEEGSSKYQMSLSTPVGSPSTPTTPSPTAARKENVWRSVFHPGSNINAKHLGGQLYDQPQPNSPTIYDWLYSGETRSKHA